MKTLFLIILISFFISFSFADCPSSENFGKKAASDVENLVTDISSSALTNDKLIVNGKRMGIFDLGLYFTTILKRVKEESKTPGTNPLREVELSEIEKDALKYAKIKNFPENTRSYLSPLNISFQFNNKDKLFAIFLKNPEYKTRDSNINVELDEKKLADLKEKGVTHINRVIDKKNIVYHILKGIIFIVEKDPSLKTGKIKEIIVYSAE